jgi:hypothetical protein
VLLYVDPLVTDFGVAATLVDDVRDFALSNNQSVRTKYQSYDGGRGWYNEHLVDKETPFDVLYHDVWNTFFTPAAPVAKAIKFEMDLKGLVPGEYASAHVRALYALKSRPLGAIQKWTTNALNCASNLRPGKPIFLASDSKHSAEQGVAYGEWRKAKVVTHENHPNPPLHLDKAENVTNTTVALNHPPSDYYDTFIDLYLLAFGRCVFISKGGYGSWALLIGGNISCVHKQKRTKRGFHNPCEWMDYPNGTEMKEARLTEPLFLEPMDHL